MRSAAYQQSAVMPHALWEGPRDEADDCNEPHEHKGQNRDRDELIGF